MNVHPVHVRHHYDYDYDHDYEKAQRRMEFGAQYRHRQRRHFDPSYQYEYHPHLQQYPVHAHYQPQQRYGRPELFPVAVRPIELPPGMSIQPPVGEYRGVG